MKKWMVFMLCAVMALSFTACGAPSSSGETEVSSTAEHPNPFTTCQTPEEAAALAGFSITLPDSISGFDTRVIRASKDTMIEVIYQNETGEIRIRKAPGSDDISGDYTAYTESRNVTVDELQVTLKGADGNVSLAIWSNGEYAFSARFSEALSGDDAAALIGTIR